MAGFSKTSAPASQISGPVEDHSGEVDGYTINFMALAADIDGAPLLKGLPDDRCQCPHWGYVLKGKVTFHIDNRNEVYEAGDAFYVGPGHTPFWVAGTEFVQFSPTAELAVVRDHMIKAMAQAQPA